MLSLFLENLTLNKLMNIVIGNQSVGPDNSVFVVAEISGNHDGKIDNALDLVRAAKRVGAHAIKLQTYTPDTITLKSAKSDFRLSSASPWSDYDSLWALYEKAHTPWEWHEEIFALARELGLIFFSSPFDPSAVEFLEGFDVPAHKIASPEINDLVLLKAVAQTKKPVIVSTGMATKDDIDLAITTLKDNGAKDIILLKCTSAYPTPYEDMHLASIPQMRKDYQLNIGLSDHSLGIVAPIVATSFGAVMIEKHIVIDEEQPTVDSGFSSSEAEFARMCEMIKQAQASIGLPNYDMAPSVQRTYNGGRSLYVAENIAEGEFLTENNIRSVRPGFGLHTKYFDDAIGKRATKALEAGDRLSFDDFE